MPTAAQVKHLRDLTGAGMRDIRHALERAGDDPWLAMGHLRVKGLAVSVNVRQPDGSTRPATAAEAERHWDGVAARYAAEYRVSHPGLADEIALIESQIAADAARRGAEPGGGAEAPESPPAPLGLR